MTSSTLMIVRPAKLPDDYPAVSRAIRADWPDGPMAEDLAHEDAARDPAPHVARFITEDAGQPVGTLFVGHDTWEHREGKFKFDLRVAPDYWQRGAGDLLYQTMLDDLALLQPCELHTDIWATHPHAVDFIIGRGFVARWRRLDLFLDVPSFDFTPYDGLEAKVAAQGVTIKTYVELADDPMRDRKLYALDCATLQDIPLGELSALGSRSFERFVKEVLQHPDFLPEACFVAIKADDTIGYCMHNPGDEALNVDMTGVLRPYRNKGIATLLKLRGIRYACEHGYTRLSTVNDPTNAAMLGLNQKLGFQVEGANIRFVLKR